MSVLGRWVCRGFHRPLRIIGLSPFRALSSHIDFSADYYKALGVGQTEQLGDIKKAYYGMAKRYHPDSVEPGTQPEVARKKFAEASAAYEVLSDAGTRREYDMMRGNRVRAPVGSSRPRGFGAQGYYGGGFADEDQFSGSEFQDLDLEWLVSQGGGWAESEVDEMDAWVNFFRKRGQGPVDFGVWEQSSPWGRNGTSRGKKSRGQGAKAPGSGAWKSANPRPAGAGQWQSAKPKGPSPKSQSAKAQKSGHDHMHANAQKAWRGKPTVSGKERGQWTGQVDLAFGRDGSISFRTQSSWTSNSPRSGKGTQSVTGKAAHKKDEQPANYEHNYGPRKGYNRNSGKQSHPRPRWEK
jgi:curved DNA-binding protein CbpA